MRVAKTFRFEAAHSLPHLPVGHKCHRLHGHSYEVEIAYRGPRDSMGWVLDYAEISRRWAPLHDKLDHRNLDEVLPGKSTAEELAWWIWQHLKPQDTAGGAWLSSVTVRETASTSVTVSVDSQ